MNSSKQVTIKGMKQNGSDYEVTAEVYEESEGCMMIRTKSGSLLAFKDGQVSSFRGTNFRTLAIHCWIEA